MELITLDSEAFKKIMEQILNIEKKIDEKVRKNPLSEKWLDIQEVCQLLKISKRTLQSYRDKKILSYSQIGGKIYFKAVDIDNHLINHYCQCDPS